MAKGIKGVCGFIIKGTVAIQEHSVVAELHVAHQDLCGTVQTLVKEEAVSVQKMHFAIGRRTASAVGLLAHRCHSHKQAKAERQERTEDV